MYSISCSIYFYILINFVYFAFFIPLSYPITMKFFILLSCILSTGYAQDSYVILPWRTSPFQPLKMYTWNGTAPKTGRNYTGHYGIIQDQSLFRFELPSGGCVNRTNVTVSSKMFGCEVATNGGFFSFSGSCEGNTVINSTVVTWTNQNRSVFGVLPNKTTVVGYIASSSTLPFVSLLSGLGYLVNNGVNYVNQAREFLPNASKSSFVTEKAPRTAIGITKQNELALIVVDGVEVLGLGIDLFEFADILIEAVDIQYAINLDGGGSSDMVYNHQIYSRPTCSDQLFPICERPVTSFTCISYAA